MRPYRDGARCVCVCVNDRAWLCEHTQITSSTTASLQWSPLQSSALPPSRNHRSVRRGAFTAATAVLRRHLSTTRHGESSTSRTIIRARTSHQLSGQQHPCHEVRAGQWKFAEGIRSVAWAAPDFDDTSAGVMCWFLPTGGTTGTPRTTRLVGSEGELRYRRSSSRRIFGLRSVT